MRHSDALENFLSTLAYERGLAHNTLLAYRRDLRQYLLFIEESPFTPQRIVDFVEHLAEIGLSLKSVARKLAAIKGFHRYLCDEEGVKLDPSVNVKPPKLPRSLPKALTTDEVFALLNAPNRSTISGLRDLTLLEFLYSTGCRASEAVGLDIGHLDIEQGVAIVTGKGSRQRIVLMGVQSREIMEQWLWRRVDLARNKTQAVFLNLRGSRLSRISIWNIVKLYAKRAGLSPERVSPHVLRHSAATHMVEGGADLRTVQEMLGHANLSTTEVYTRVSPGFLHEVYVLSHPRSR